MKIGIVVPAHNEEQRIAQTLHEYVSFFDKKAVEDQFSYELIVVLNGCTDDTIGVVTHISKNMPTIHILDYSESGKGFAVRRGFECALERGHDMIGFVDADMATEPQYFYELIPTCKTYDGVIASRYLPESRIFPERPLMKSWGRKIVYNGMTRALFGLKYADLQCGAKLFKRTVVEHVTPHLMVRQWAFDVELLYLTKKYGFSVHEQPTVWFDKDGSKLQPLRAGLHMLWSLLVVRYKHLPFSRS